MSYDIKPLKNRLLVKYPAFASTIVNANYHEANIKTLSTDGKDIYYNPNFLNSLSFDEQLFSLAHEICHIRSNHIMRSKNKDFKLWNIATDAVINQLLIEDGLKIPPKGINIPEAINYSAEEYYEKLLEKQAQTSNENSQSQNQPSSKSNQKNESENYNNPSNIDDHTMWTKTLKQRNPNELEKPNEQQLFSQNRKEKIENLKKLKEELLNQSLQAGKETNSVQFSLDNIGNNKPLIDWRTLLKKSANIKLKWDTRKPDVEYKVLIPKLRRLAYPKTEILLDTSGSINETMLKNFLRECKYLLKNSEISVGCFDTKFYGFQKINSEKDIENMNFYGRGGTDFDVAINAFSSKADNKIIFTDGYAEMPKNPSNVIWVVFGNKKITPLKGTVIYINKNQLVELQSNRKVK